MMSQITWKEKSLSADQWRIMMLSASYGAAFPSVAHGIAAAYMVETSTAETAPKPVKAKSPALNRSKIMSYLGDLWDQYKTYRKLNECVGKDVEIPFYRSKDIFWEAKRHKWIEAEKAGRDIWAERDPQDPDGCALRDWVSKYLDAWKKNNMMASH